MFIFVVAALIAILLNPIVRAFTRFRLPRPLAVATVYIAFAVILGAIAVVVATVVANQVQDVLLAGAEGADGAAGPDRHPGRAQDRAPPDLAEHARPRPHPHQAARQRGRPARPDARRQAVHRPGGEHRPGGRGRRLREPVRRRAGDRDLDLHAARHAPALALPAPPVPGQPPRGRPHPALREGAHLLRPRPDAGVPRDRHHGRRRHVHPGPDRRVPRRLRLRPGVRRVGGRGRGRPLHRPVAGRGAAVRGGAAPLARRGPGRCDACSSSSTRSRATSSSPS